MKLSFHVQHIPCPEEYYMGASVSNEAYDVEVPDDNVPKELLDIINKKTPGSSVIAIAIHR